jgi:hypothetical protein
MALDLDDARKRYHYCLNEEDRARLPFYDALVNELETDTTSLELLASVPVEHRNPMLVLATLQLASFRGHDVLTSLYDSVRRGDTFDTIVAARRVVDVVRDDPDLVRRELHRYTQTNEPGRSAVLQAVIARMSQRHPGPVNLVDVGTSASINLFLDKFRVTAVDDGDPLSLVCRDLGGVDRSLALPYVASRVGIDIAPLDLANADDRLWLESCVWPEERRRQHRLEAIVDAWPTWPSFEVLVGSATARLDDALAVSPSTNLTVVINTWAAFYFSKAEQHDYYEMMTARCANGNVAWISVESPYGIEWPTPSSVSVPPQSGGTHVLVTEPGGVPTSWGWCHHHGLWLWLDS